MQIYVPRIPGVSNEFAYTPEQFNFSFEDVWLTAADGVKLHAWFMWPQEWAQGVLATKPTVLFLQVQDGSALRLCQSASYFQKDVEQCWN